MRGEIQVHDVVAAQAVGRVLVDQVLLSLNSGSQIAVVVADRGRIEV